MELLELGFMQRALLASILVGGVCSLIGTFVVTRRLSFLGDGLAHTAFGGIGIGIFLRQDPLLVAIPFTVLVALLIAWTHRRARLSADTAIGTFFAVSIALGILLIHLGRGTGIDIHAYLFGDVLAVSQRDILTSGVVAAVVGVAVTVLWPRLAYATFDPDLAQISGVPVRHLEYLLFALVAVTVVVGMRVVGILLVAAFLVIPAATARLLARTLLAVTLLAILLGVLASVAGLMLSTWLDVPSGSTMVLVQGGLFFLGLAFRTR
jgi:zinc transport system permease protein